MPDPSASGSSTDPGPATTAGLGLFGAPRQHDGERVCSRKGCRADAQWQLLWNNPRIHTPERRKAWAACTDHRVWFEEYLGERGLWKQTLPLVAGQPMETR